MMDTPSASSEYSSPTDSGIAGLECFPANDDDHRYLRLRCGMLCAAFNAQPLSTSREERARLWYDVVDPHVRDNGELPEAPMIKSPIYMDYGVNVHIAPSSFLNRNCVISDAPEHPITIKDNTIIGVGVHVLGVTHSVDWRERNGRNGPSLAGAVTIGKNCFIGSHVVIMPGITIGDGCVIGPSSVVTRSIPAYHVAVGSPARPIRKVSVGVPDAPGLRYEQRGDLSVVVRTIFDKRPVSQDMSEDTTSAFDQAAEAEKQLVQVLDEMKSATSRRVVVDVVVFIVAVVGSWLIIHALLY